MVEDAAGQKAVALVPAAGGGTRLGQGPKAFLQIHGKSLLQHVVELLAAHVGRILVGVPEEYLAQAKEELKGQAEVYAGGATRLGTIANLLARSSESLVVIHDAARPFTSHEVLSMVIAEGQKHGAAGACRRARVPIARIKNGVATSAIPASEGGTIETPLAYHRAMVERAFQYARAHQIEDASLSDLVLRSGGEMRAIIDSEWNFKITTALDWEIATKVIAPAFWPHH
jgi:2-C-methyl-D-erythritol 4-phosphate cytidylyltransferase